MLAALLLLATGFTQPRVAESSGPSLEWRAPAECPNADVVLERFGQLLQGSSAVLPAATTAVIRRTGAGYALALTWQGAAGPEQRTFTATTCELLVKVAATTLAVQASEITARRSEAPSLPAASQTPSVPLPSRQAPGPTGVTGIEPRREEPPRSRPRESRTKDHRGASTEPRPAVARPPGRASLPSRNSGPHGPWLAILGGALALPRVSVGAEVGYSWRPKWTEFDVAIRYWPPREASLPEGITGRARVGMFSVPIAGCIRFGRSSLEFPMCAVVVSGLQWARGDASVPNVKGSPELEIWWAAGARGSLRWLFHHRLSLRASVSLLGSLRRPSFAVVEAPQLPFHRPEVVAVRFGLALELHARPRSAR